MRTRGTDNRLVFAEHRERVEMWIVIMCFHRTDNFLGIFGNDLLTANHNMAVTNFIGDFTLHVSPCFFPLTCNCLCITHFVVFSLPSK